MIQLTGKDDGGVFDKLKIFKKQGDFERVTVKKELRRMRFPSTTEVPAELGARIGGATSCHIAFLQ